MAMSRIGRLRWNSVDLAWRMKASWPTTRRSPRVVSIHFVNRPDLHFCHKTSSSDVYGLLSELAPQTKRRYGLGVDLAERPRKSSKWTKLGLVVGEYCVWAEGTCPWADVEATGQWDNMVDWSWDRMVTDKARLPTGGEVPALASPIRQAVSRMGP
jgi:hypothetical protein